MIISILAFIVAVDTQRAGAQALSYVVLSKKALLVQERCESNKNATLTQIGKTAGGIKASVMSLREVPGPNIEPMPLVPPMWTLVLVSGADLQADQQYALVFERCRARALVPERDLGSLTRHLR